jgi:hypothetical protein
MGCEARSIHEDPVVPARTDMTSSPCSYLEQDILNTFSIHYNHWGAAYSHLGKIRKELCPIQRAQ